MPSLRVSLFKNDPKTFDEEFNFLFDSEDDEIVVYSLSDFSDAETEDDYSLRLESKNVSLS